MGAEHQAGHGNAEGDVVAGETGRAERQAANLARHLNQSYPDMATFLAQHAPAVPQATNASFVGVTEQLVTLAVTINGEVRLEHLPLPESPQAHDTRSRLRLLIEQTRVSVPAEPAVALTSLEQMLVGTAGPAGDAQGAHASMTDRHGSASRPS